ncbi:hypothetical protein AAC387_Pa08g1564 [Persea americana]
MVKTRDECEREREIPNIRKKEIPTETGEENLQFAKAAVFPIPKTLQTYKRFVGGKRIIFGTELDVRLDLSVPVVVVWEEIKRFGGIGIDSRF